MKSARTIIAGATSAALLLLLPAAHAEEKDCRGSIGAKTVDNLKVPSGATCILDGTTVKGTIYVKRNAVLKADDVRVVGNVQGENAKNVEVFGGSIVGGSIQVVQGKKADIRGSRVGGDILFDEQDRRVRARWNKVGGNVQAFQNSGGVRISNNNIDGNLQCKANNPVPIGDGNKVEGNKEDQCKGM